MSMYSVALYLHIIGAAGMFAGLGMEGIVYSNLKNAATTRQLLQWGGTMRVMRSVFGVSVILLLLPGLYLVFEAWGWNSWVITGLLLLIALSGYGSMTGKKIGMIIGSLAGKEGSLTEEVRNRMADPWLMKSYKVKLTLALGIIFLMTIKPDWAVSIISIAAAFAAGLMLNIRSKEKQTVEELESA